MSGRLHMTIGAVCCLATAGFAQTNIASNGSFEIVGGSSLFVDWTSPGGVVGHVAEHGADGRNFVEIYNVGARIWQDVPTVAGRVYIVRFAINQSHTMRVLWNDSLIGEVGFPGAPLVSWYYSDLLTTSATGSVSRLAFEGLVQSTYLDDVSVGWVEEPPSIKTQVPSRSTFEGGTVTFRVVAIGGPPLAYQWSFRGTPITDATNQVLTITNAQHVDEGDSYIVTFSNEFGQVSTLPASLRVQPIPDAPLIVAQPKSFYMTEGYLAGFYVFAVGSPPLSYQWRFNNADILDATNSHYSIPAVAMSNAGPYTVLVSNHFGTTLSIPASLTVQAMVDEGSGYVAWGNFSFSGKPDAPVFDADGITRASGPDLVAQLYAGATSNSLHAIASPAVLGSGSTAGYYNPSPSSVQIPDVLPDATGYMQIRVWDRTRGETFEEGQALGGKFGKSDMLAVKVYGIPAIPAALKNLRSFNLQAGQSLLATAKLYHGSMLPDGNRDWLLVGDIGGQYVIEHRSPPNDWTPLYQVTNVFGTVSFVDTNAQNASIKFYRARILEP